MTDVWRTFDQKINLLNYSRSAMDYAVTRLPMLLCRTCHGITFHHSPSHSIILHYMYQWATNCSYILWYVISCNLMLLDICRCMPWHANTCHVMPTHAMSCQLMPTHYAGYGHVTAFILEEKVSRPCMPCPAIWRMMRCVSDGGW